MIKTLSIRELENKAENIYEAIVVLAKRARQINADQKQQLSREREYDDEYDSSFMEDEFNEAAALEEYEKLPKPSALALEEFIDDTVEFDYQPLEDEEKETKS